MSVKVELNAPDLASMLCSRICHDLISPVGAINNGLEVLADDTQADMKEFAQELIHKSAKQAAAKLKFSRIAFGAAGSAGAQIDTGDARAVAEEYMEGEKANIAWDVPRSLLPKSRVKLLLNLLLLIIGAVPRGGDIAVKMIGEGDDATFELVATGKAARIPSHALELVKGEAEDGHIDAHSIQPYYTGLLARECGLTIDFSIHEQTVALRAT